MTKQEFQKRIGAEISQKDYSNRGACVYMASVHQRGRG